MKKTVSFIITLALLILITMPVNAIEAADKVSPWANLYVSDAKNLYHILPDSLAHGDYTTFITREDFCELAYRTLEKEIGMTLSSGKTSFTDTNNKYIITLFNAGIIKGKSQTAFAPDDLLTREEAATILSRMADYMKLTRFPNELVYTDFYDISDGAQDSVDYVSGICVMNGTGNGIFSPKSNYTKEQAIATMIRLINNLPYLNNSTLVEGDKYFIFNQYYLWIKDSKGIVFYLPYSNYEGLDWYKRNGKIIIIATTRAFYSEFYDLASGEKLFTIPHPVRKITDNSRYIIAYEVKYSSNTVDAAYELYGVYDFNGNEILPPLYTLNYLKEYGFCTDN